MLPALTEVTRRDWARLKLRLLVYGLRLGRQAVAEVARRKPQLRTRSGVSGGIDLVLPGHVHVNCPVVVSEGVPVLDWDGESFFLCEGGELLAPANVYPCPAFYRENLPDGTPLVSVGQMCSGDRICVGMTRHCFFWRRDLRCRFCSIGDNVRREAPHKTAEGIAEAVDRAARDAVLPARHVLIGGGTPNDTDRGAVFAAETCRAIKRRVALSVYAMLVPPRDLGMLALLRDSGVDEIGFNIEMFDPAARERHAPGKHALVPLPEHYRALERAVDLFGPGNTRSIAIVGLEPPEVTIAGAARLAAMGVLPILSPFRPLSGSDLEAAQPPDIEVLVETQEAAYEACAAFGLPPGPYCIPCQNNTAALPIGGGIRYYGEPWPGVLKVEPSALAQRQVRPPAR